MGRGFRGYRVAGIEGEQMSTALYTPGPWSAGDPDEFETFIWSADKYIGSVSGEEMEAGERNGNARLIAAAPDLLAACEAAAAAFARADKETRPLADNWADLRAAAETALVAIAKAKGTK